MICRTKTNQILAANRGEYIEGISDPNDAKWVTEDLTKTNSNAEATSDVQMEENFGNETEVNNEISESETAVETGMFLQSGSVSLRVIECCKKTDSKTDFFIFRKITSRPVNIFLAGHQRDDQCMN